jgi:hypothetical protein
MKDGNLLMLVSILVAPYCWIIDESLAIPALLQGAYLTRFRPMLAVLALASVVIEAELMSGCKLFSDSYVWTAPAWLAWYLYATWNKDIRTTADHNVVAEDALQARR